MMATTSPAVVQYGRRKGRSRAQSAEAHSEEVSAGAAMPNLIDIRQMTVLPKAEWERIKNNVNSLEREAMQIYEEMKEREALHLRSKEVVKNWTNTIVGQRQKRLKSKQLREEKEEEEKKKIDLEEAKFQAEKRREAIEKARTKQYYESDKIKKFHGALLLAEVMKEREAQIELKNKRLNFHQKKDKEDKEGAQRELEESILLDQQKVLERLTLTRKNNDEVLKQIEDKKHAEELEKLADRREGEDIKRLTREYEAEMYNLHQKKMAQKQDIMKHHLAYVADRDFLRALDKQKQESEEDRIRNYVVAKKKMAGLRKAKEEEINRLIEERSDQITELLAAEMRQRVDNEDERIRNAVAELEAKSKRESQEKEEKIKADIKAITENRLAVKKQKELDERLEKFQAMQALHDIKEADDFFIAQQREKKRRAEEEEKKTQTVRIQQMAEKKTMTILEKEAEQKYDKINETLIAKEEEQFQEYANQVIDSVTRAGWNPYPLKKAAQSGTGGGHGPVYPERGGIRPSYLVQDSSGVQLPAYKNGTTQQIKEIYEAGDIQQSKKKLGFTW
ncbi:cilia- and flagella- associated protein 210 [Discoglossus pictus]